MTKFEYIKSLDLETFATFLWAMCDEVQNKCMMSIADQGYDVGKVGNPILEIASFIADLQKEI